MDVYTIKRQVGEDGILRIELPLGVSNAEVEVVVVVQAIAANKVKNISDKLARANEPWTEEEEQQLLRLYNSGASMSVIAKEHQRTKGAIQSRLKKLGIDAEVE